VTAVAAAGALALPLVGASVGRLAGAGSGPGNVALWGYEAALVLIAAGFLADSLRGRWAQAAVTRLVVDLGGDSEAGTLRARLAHALGDPSLAVAYWLPEAKRYVDERGDPVDLPAAGSGRAVTIIDDGGERIAALVHDLTVLDAPGLADSVAEAARIAVSNVRLRAGCSAGSQSSMRPGAGSSRPAMLSAIASSCSCGCALASACHGSGISSTWPSRKLARLTAGTRPDG
jgi:hypothetical protein